MSLIITRNVRNTRHQDTTMNKRTKRMVVAAALIRIYSGTLFINRSERFSMKYSSFLENYVETYLILMTKIDYWILYLINKIECWTLFKIFFAMSKWYNFYCKYVKKYVLHNIIKIWSQHTNEVADMFPFLLCHLCMFLRCSWWR